jgi:hypothetical protein
MYLRHAIHKKDGKIHLCLVRSVRVGARRVIQQTSPSLVSSMNG